MVATDAGRPAGVDFEEFARARQGTLARAAFLVCGDERLAQDRLTVALLALARHWHRVSHEQPDLFVRRTLYRDVVARCGGRRSEARELRTQPARSADSGSFAAEPVERWDEETRRRVEASLSEPLWEEPDAAFEVQESRRRARMLQALDTLTPRQRALVVLLYFDDHGKKDAGDVLGIPAVDVGTEALGAVTALRAALPAGWLDDFPSVQGRDLEDLLRLASDAVPAVDQVEGLWDEAHHRHRAVVRRTVLGLGAVAAAGLALTVVRREPLSRTVSTPVGSATAPGSATPTGGATAVAADGRLPSVEVDGVTVFLAPDPVGERRLPRYPGADELSIPLHVGPCDPSKRAVLGEGGVAGVAAPVRAVFLVNGADLARPVLFALDARVPYVEVPRAQVLGWGLANSREITDDRHRIVFGKVRGVAVLDARDGSVVEVEVPDPTLRAAGWARDGRTIIAHGRFEDWVVDYHRRSAVSSPEPRHTDWADLGMGDRGALVRTFSRSGELTGARQLLGPLVVPNGQSVANEQQWVAGYAYLAEGYQRVVESKQGLVAVRAGPHPLPTVLAASLSPIVPDRCYHALRWATPSVVLLESGWQQTGLEVQLRSILAWDVAEGRLWRVAVVDRAGEDEGEFNGEYAI